MIFINEITSYTVLKNNKTTANLIPNIIEKGFLYSGSKNVSELMDIESNEELEFIEGPFILLENLVDLGYQTLSDFSFTLDNEKKILKSALICISKIHCAGVGHGDIRSANIFINNQIDIKLIDFGFFKSSQTFEERSKNLDKEIREYILYNNLKNIFENDYFKLFEIFDEKFSNFTKSMTLAVENSPSLKLKLGFDAKSANLISFFVKKAAQFEIDFVNEHKTDEFWKVLENLSFGEN